MDLYLDLYLDIYIYIYIIFTYHITFLNISAFFVLIIILLNSLPECTAPSELLHGFHLSDVYSIDMADADGHKTAPMSSWWMSGALFRRCCFVLTVSSSFLYVCVFLHVLPAVRLSTSVKQAGTSRKDGAFI